MLPYAIYPSIEQHALSGSTYVDKDRVIAFYPGVGAGQMVAISKDPLLLNWEKIGPVIKGKPFVDFWDSDIWKEGDTYVGLVGGLRKYYPESDVPPNHFGAASFMQHGNGVWPKLALWTRRTSETGRLPETCSSRTLPSLIGSTTDRVPTF